MIIEISNIKERQLLEINRLFIAMQICWSIWASRNISVFADWDWSFRPKIKIDWIDLKEIIHNKNNWFIEDNWYVKDESFENVKIILE